MYKLVDLESHKNGEILNNLHTEYAEFKKGDDIFS